MLDMIRWLTGTESEQLTAAQQWGLAAGGILTELNRLGFDKLRCSTGRSKALSALRDGWGVSDRANLQRIRDWLVREGHRMAYLRVAKTVDAIEAGEIAYDADSSNAPVYRWVSNYRAQISRTGFVSWDFSRLVNVARWGYTSGYIDRPTAWQWIMESARAIQAKCTAWQDVGDDFIAGFGIWSQGKPLPRSFQETYERLLASRLSPWRQLPFDTPLES